MPRGYYKRKDPLDRFLEKVEKTDSCWLWLGCLNHNGYGRFSYELKTVPAHRWLYERVVGPIPEGFQIDHLCRNPRCVNPAHLEAVTPQVNTLRGDTPAAANAEKQFCPQGHPLGENRKCLICRAAATKRWRDQHLDEIREKKRAYTALPEVKAHIAEKQRERRAKDPEAYRAYMREYYRKRRTKTDE